jgi:hypothetical protein
VETEFGDSNGIEGAHRSGKWKWWLVIVPAMVVTSGEFMNTLLPRPDGFYREVSILSVTVATTVLIAPVCQSLRTKLAVRKKHEHTGGQNAQKWWYVMLLSLVAIEALFIGISFLLINRIYWQIVVVGARENLAMLGAFVPLVGSYGLGSFLIVSLRKHLRVRRITLRALVTYAAGAAMTLALPFCVRRQEYVWGDLVEGYLTVRWSALGVIVLSLALIAGLTLQVRRL